MPESYSRLHISWAGTTGSTRSLKMPSLSPHGSGLLTLLFQSLVSLACCLAAFPTTSNSASDPITFSPTANQRAGAWYVKPDQNEQVGSSAEHYAYFKSTDGHIGQPAFNLRRANLVLLPLIKEKQGSARQRV